MPQPQSRQSSKRTPSHRVLYRDSVVMLSRVIPGPAPRAHQAAKLPARRAALVAEAADFIAPLHEYDFLEATQDAASFEAHWAPLVDDLTRAASPVATEAEIEAAAAYLIGVEIGKRRAQRGL